MRKLVVILTVLTALVTVGIAVAAGAFEGAKPATARFHDLDQAKADPRRSSTWQWSRTRRRSESWAR